MPRAVPARKAAVARKSWWRRFRRSIQRVRILRSILSGLDRIPGDACASCAEMLFRNPPRRRPVGRERAWLSQGRLSRLRGSNGEIAVWSWGSGPRVLLAHGWGGHSGRLTAFLPALLDAGFGVVAFDAPAHGVSQGWLATLPDFADALMLVAGVTGPVGLVGHSMGAAACALAMRRGLPIRGAVLLAPPADPEAYTIRYARYMRLSANAAASMRARLERRYRVKLGDLRLPSQAPTVPTLVVHDRRDGRVPLCDGIAITRAWPRSELVVTTGLGHHRILRNREVIERSVSFLRLSLRDANRLIPKVLPAPGNPLPSAASGRHAS